MMLKERAVADSFAATSAIVYICFYWISIIWPGLFNFLFNTQFLGANVAATLPRSATFEVFFASLVGIIGVSWLVGFLWAKFYNHFSE